MNEAEEIESLWPAEFVRAGIPPGHCRDVLSGCYYVFFEGTAPVVLDIGANVGAYARWVRSQWPDAELHCYEPEPENFRLLSKTADSLGGKINCHNVAVLDAETHMDLYPGEFNCGEWSLCPGNKNHGAPKRVPVIDAARLPDADIIKIDTEGAELKIVQQLAASGKLDRASVVVLEWHRSAYAKELPKILEQHGLFVVHDDTAAEHRGVLRFMRSRPAPTSKPMRKILIGTPIKGGISARYLMGFIQVMRKKFPDLIIEHCLHDGTSVNFARNEICYYALGIGAREILWIDEDMEWNIDHFERILSHIDVDIVGGLYCKKLPGDPFWLTNAKEGAEIDPVTGLCEVDELATGFLKVRVDTVLKKMMQEFPEREYYAKGINGDGTKNKDQILAFEFFPMGVMGPRSPGARLERVKAALESTTVNHDEFRRLVYDACYDKQEPGNLFGEDYYFCRMARACGFKVYADFGMPPIGHIGKISFPIVPEMVGLDPQGQLDRAEAKEKARA